MTQTEQDLSKRQIEDEKLIQDHFPFIQAVTSRSEDLNLTSQIDSFNILLEGLWVYGEWLTQSSLRIPNIQDEKFDDELSRLDNEYSQVAALLKDLESVRDKPLEVFLSDVSHQKSLKKMIDDTQRNLHIEDEKSRQSVELPVSSKGLLKYHFQQFNGLEHSLRGAQGGVSNSIDSMRILGDNLPSDEKRLHLLQSFNHSRKRISMEMGMFQNIFEHARFSAGDFAYLSHHNEPFQALLSITQIRQFPDIVRNPEFRLEVKKCDRYTVDWDDKWFFVIEEEIVINAAKAYTERDGQYPDLEHEKKTLETNYVVYGNGEMTNLLSEFEFIRFNNHSLSKSESILVVSFIDNGIGVDSIVEDNGLVIGQTIHHTDNVSGTGYGISFQNEILGKEYGGMIFVHNRHDGIRGAEVMVCLPAEKVTNEE